MSTPSFNCLFVIFAREAHLALIFRRGPRTWLQMILWNTDTDVFTEGQWFKGSVYTRRCDISPDGSKVIYFSAKHYKKNDQNATIKNNWTAISRPPYFTALAIWDTSDTHGGGGYFEDNYSVYLDISSYQIEQQVHLLPPNFKIDVLLYDEHAINPERNLYNLLLEKRGWIRLQNGQSHAAEYPKVWQKDDPSHSYQLLMMMTSGYENNATLEFYLIRHADNTKFKIDAQDWADWDHRGRLVYSNGGQLFTQVIQNNSAKSTVLSDFNNNKPTQIQSPVWARTWNEAKEDWG